MAIPIQFIPEIPESKLSSSVQTKLNSGDGGSSNPSIRIATTQAHLTTALSGGEKEINIQGNITLSSNITFPSGAVISDGGGIVTVGSYQLTFTNNSFKSDYTRTFINLGASGTINSSSTFSNSDIILNWFGLVGDGNIITNTGTNNRNVFLQATKIANKAGGNIYIKNAGNYMMSVVTTRGSQDEPTNWYITNGVNLYLDKGVTIGQLTTSGISDTELLSVWNTEYSTIKGGQFVGDLRTHSFFTEFDEGCMGIRIVGDSNTRYNTIENVKFTDFVGDNIYQQINPNFYHLNAITSATLTKGYTLDDSGVAEANDSYAYSQLLSLANFHDVNPMVVGGGSFSGFCGLDNQTYYAVYYDASDVFIAKTGLLKFYQPVPIHDDYIKVRIVIHTPNDAYADFDSKDGITVFSPSRASYTTIQNCDITYGYRNGISNLGYGSRFIYNRITYNGRKHDGTPGTLGLGMDLEDSYQNIQNVEIAHNTFINNKSGNLALIGSVDCSIHDNKFLYNDDPAFDSGNTVYMYQATRAQYYNNLNQGSTITLARQSEMFNNNMQDCTVLLYTNKETIRDHSNLTNVNLQQTTVDAFNQVSYVRNNIFKYTKLSAQPILKNSLNWIVDNCTWDLGNLSINTEDALSNKSAMYSSSYASTNEAKLSIQAQEGISRGFYRNFIVKNLVPEAPFEDSFEWGVVDMDDFRIETTLRLRAGGSKNATFKNGYVGGKLEIALDYYPATNAGTFNTLYFINDKFQVPSNDYLLYTDAASFLTSGAKDVNLVFKDCHFIMPDVANDNKWFYFLHYGTLLFENCTFESLGTSTADMADSTCGIATFKNCTLINTTLTKRATDVIL